MVQEKMLLNLYLLKAFSLSHGSNRCPIPTIDRKQKKNHCFLGDKPKTNPIYSRFLNSRTYFKKQSFASVTEITAY